MTNRIEMARIPSSDGIFLALSLTLMLIPGRGHLHILLLDDNLARQLPGMREYRYTIGKAKFDHSLTVGALPGAYQA